MGEKLFGLDGTPWTNEHAISPIVLLMEDTPLYLCGWYFCDEVEQLNGPFSSFKEAIDALHVYGETL